MSLGARRPPELVRVEPYGEYRLRVLTRGELRALFDRDDKRWPHFDSTLLSLSLCGIDGARLYPPFDGELPDPETVKALDGEDWPLIRALCEAATRISGLDRKPAGDDGGKAGGDPDGA